MLSIKSGVVVGWRLRRVKRGSMNKIITVSREFGSGGRELAQQMAERLGFQYYDKEIIAEMVKQSKFDGAYIENVANAASKDFPYAVSKSMAFYSAHQKQTTEILVLEKKIIQQLAAKGDCVFVGRSADIILSEYNPLNIFVYADTETKIKRCQIKTTQNQHLSDKEILKGMKEIDQARKNHYFLLGVDNWGDKENYHLCVNTSGMKIKDLVPMVTAYAKTYFKAGQ